MITVRFRQFLLSRLWQTHHYHFVYTNVNKSGSCCGISNLTALDLRCWPAAIITKARLENTRLEEEGKEESRDNKCKKETQKQLSKLSDDVDDDNNQRDRSQRVLCPLLLLLFFPLYSYASYHATP